jgi:hypothetical protein
MAFPSNPTNGQTANVNGVVYTYDSTLTAWAVTTNFSGNVTVNQINANVVLSTGNVSGSNLVSSGNILSSGVVSATSNITGGNILSSGVVSATSNITGGNLITAGLASVTGTLTIGSTASFGGNITAVSILPVANATHDLGSSASRWRNIYTSDLHLNNGIGNWTVVEGEEDLFLHNNNNNKVYKFVLVEVDPSQSPPKQKAG